MSDTTQWQPTKKMYGGIILGFTVRKSLNKTVTFRVRYGNGYYGAVLGQRYQDKYDYFVPTSINNTESAYVRTAFSAAVYNWKNTLSAAEKAEYNKRASRGLGMSGYNLYISEYVKATT